MLGHKNTVTLEMEWLYLRQFKVEDAEVMFRNWARDPEVTKFLTWPTHSSVEISKAVIETEMVHIGYCIGRAY